MNESHIITVGIVDDHQIVLDGLVANLKSTENFKVLFALNSAKKALLQLNEVTPDIIISDMSMPEMNGLEFVKTVRNKYPSIKILALSMFSNLVAKENLEGYMLKETPFEDLKQAIIGIVLEGKSYYYESGKRSKPIQFRDKILTKREKEIVIHLSEGYTSDQIGVMLNISTLTVDSHKKNIFHKLQIHNLAELAIKALQLGIVK
ncbi:response regulator transcription factor [Flavobacterium sp.]|uniref:response regulator transcription factor n=1 Tax=Flavobacterium sp. TaxID=239 RepID=UPI0025FBCAA0|nr:response regulator transcription factor [Flavobacterium sp.]